MSENEEIKTEEKKVVINEEKNSAETILVSSNKID